MTNQLLPFSSSLTSVVNQTLVEYGIDINKAADLAVRPLADLQRMRRQLMQSSIRPNEPVPTSPTAIQPSAQQAQAVAAGQAAGRLALELEVLRHLDSLIKQVDSDVHSRGRFQPLKLASASPAAIGIQRDLDQLRRCLTTVYRPAKWTFAGNTVQGEWAQGLENKFGDGYGESHAQAQAQLLELVEPVLISPESSSRHRLHRRLVKVKAAVDSLISPSTPERLAAKIEQTSLIDQHKSLVDNLWHDNAVIEMHRRAADAAAELVEVTKAAEARRTAIQNHARKTSFWNELNQFGHQFSSFNFYVVLEHALTYREQQGIESVETLFERPLDAMLADRSEATRLRFIALGGIAVGSDVDFGLPGLS